MDHDSSAVGRAQMRAIVALETKFGVPSKYARVVFYTLLLLVLCSVLFVSSSLLFEDEGDEMGGLSFSSMMGGDGDGEESPVSSSVAVGGGDDGEGEEEEEDGGGGGEEEEEEGGGGEEAGGDEEASVSKVVLSADTSGRFHDAQLKKFQERDKSFMKFFSKFRKDTEITVHFKELMDLYGELGMIKQVALGKTYEHKQIYAYELGKGTRSVLLLAGERGNEWAGSMALTYFATRLLQKYSLTPQVSAILNDLTLRIVPIVNPDGYAYHKSDWFMNRDKKHGADVSQDFTALTQLESQAVDRYAKEHQSDLYGFVNVKCCQGLVSLPKQAVCAKTEEDQMSLASRVGLAMGKGGKFKYSVRPDAAESADSPSYAHRELGLGLSFTLDVKQDKPSDDILITSQNVTMGLLELSKFILNDFPATKNLFGGGGAKPCVLGGAKLRKVAAAAAAALATSDGDDEEEEEESTGDSQAEEEEEEDHSKSFANAKPSSSAEAASGDDGIDLSVQVANRKQRKLAPPPANPDDTFLYFAYGPDMLYDVLLKAGLTSAWKVSNAKLTGYTYDYTYHSNKKWKSGIADMVKSPHSAMYGVVWRLDLSQMPLLLEWQSATSEASPLGQKLVSVESATGEVFTGISFYVRKKMRGEDILEKYHRFNPSRQYRNCVLRGAKSNKLPLDYIDHKLKSRTLGPLFTDKVGTMSHRNDKIGNVCDPLGDVQ
ncbi:hypothetical protein BASA81_001156 [Batrachochytrium salamandrivorans]|nr:hypothetical protein BASA81_001156 [Batrachochytrium salamandrivorans]